MPVTLTDIHSTFISLYYDVLQHISVEAQKACPVFVYATLKASACALACGNVDQSLACVSCIHMLLGLEGLCYAVCTHSVPLTHQPPHPPCLSAYDVQLEMVTHAGTHCCWGGTCRRRRRTLRKSGGGKMALSCGGCPTASRALYHKISITRTSQASVGNTACKRQEPIGRSQ